MNKIRYVPPTIEDVNTLGHYPYAMACLLAHTALHGVVDTDGLRHKISELVDGEMITTTLDAEELNGSRMVLKTLDLISVEDIEPELKTETNKASIERGIPLIGVLGGLRCSPPAGADIRPVFDFDSRCSTWDMIERINFFDYVISADCRRASDIREHLGMRHTVFIKQMERFEAAGMITRERTRPSSRLDATNITVRDEVCEPMINLLGQYKGLWSEAGREWGATRAYEILDSPSDFAQLLNSGVAPRRHNDKALRASLVQKPPKQEVRRMSYPEINPDILAVFTKLGGSPLEMSYLLAHCQNPQAWLSYTEGAKRLGEEWCSKLSNVARWNRIQYAREKLIDSGILEANPQKEARLTLKGILEAVPAVSLLAEWWLELPVDANSRKLLKAGAQLSRELKLLNAILNLEGKKVRSFTYELNLRSQDLTQLRRLSTAGILDIDRKSSPKTSIRSMRIASTERPHIVDLLNNFRALKDNEQSAIDATAGAMAIARSSEMLDAIASIVWQKRGNN